MNTQFRLVLAVLVLTAVAGTVAQVVPRSSGLVPLALLLDSVPFAAAVVATLIATRPLMRDHVPVARLLVAAYTYFAGALIGALGVAHLTAVVVASIHRQSRFLYDFRFYSLILLGAVLVVTGVMAAMQSGWLARGHRVAWRGSLSVWAAILAVNLPLVPLQRFAVLFSALAVLALLLLGGIRGHFIAADQDEARQRMKTIERKDEGDRVVVRRAPRYSSEDIHRTVFARAPRRRSIEELKQGVAEHIRKKHARR